jgi:hypothetical protein
LLKKAIKLKFLKFACITSLKNPIEQSYQVEKDFSIQKLQLENCFDNIDLVFYYSELLFLRLAMEFQPMGHLRKIMTSHIWKGVKSDES